MGDDNAAEPVKSHLQILHEKQGKKRKRKEDKLLKVNGFVQCLKLPFI